MLTLVLMVWSIAPVVDGDDQEITNSGEVLRKGLSKLGHSLAPLDACFLTDDLHVEAHLLGHLTDAGKSPVAGFLLDAGDGFQLKLRNREGLRENGIAER
jgi:hypothetical protein